MLTDVSRADIYRFKYAGDDNNDDSDNGLESQDPLKRLLIPLFTESVAAGFPSPAADYIEANLDLNELCIDNPVATFFVRVRGLSMVGAGIQPGDLVVVDRSLEASSGSIVLALIENEFTLKRLKKTAGNHFWLLPENPDFPAIQVKEEMGFEVWGVVISVIHFFGGKGSGSGTMSRSKLKGQSGSNRPQANKSVYQSPHQYPDQPSPGSQVQQQNMFDL